MNASLENLKWDLIPEHMRGAVERWISHGIAPGSFLKAFLCNDLKETFARADDINAASIRNYVSFFYSYAPSQCWGSPAKFAEWEAAGGLVGVPVAEAAS